MLWRDVRDADLGLLRSVYMPWKHLCHPLTSFETNLTVLHHVHYQIGLHVNARVCLVPGDTRPDSIIEKLKHMRLPQQKEGEEEEIVNVAQVETESSLWEGDKELRPISQGAELQDLRAGNRLFLRAWGELPLVKY